MSYKRLVSVHLAPVSVQGEFTMTLLIKQLSLQNIHDNCLIHRLLLLLTNMNVVFQSWVTNTLILFYYSAALFMVSETTFAKRDETEGQTEVRLCFQTC